ncbi:MAG: response regulator transcription factor [Pseudonocardia sp.]
MGGARRVLVVEDEASIADAVAARLRAEGYLVDVAHDGPGAVALAEATEPDLVLLDVMLPGFDGIEVCRRIQARRPVPVLMVTARDDETDLLVGLGVGADDYLTKPFSPRELAARVHALLRRVDRARELHPEPKPEESIILGEVHVDLAGPGCPPTRCRPWPGFPSRSAAASSARSPPTWTARTAGGAGMPPAPPPGS